MTGLATFPSPCKIAELLDHAERPSEPALDLGTLEEYYTAWPYPKSLDFWEGFVYADLCEQVGWAYLKHEEYPEALSAWRKCPWPSSAVGERQAVAHILQAAYEDQSLVLSPPVGDLFSQGRLQPGSLLSMLDDTSSELFHSSSGNGYIVTSKVVKPEGLWHLRFEFDVNTLFFVLFLPAEVYHKMTTARAYFQMGEAKDSARWLLRAAFLAQNEGLGPEAFSLLEKAEQLDPENQAIKTSINNLRVKGIGATLSSRVVVERSMFQPEPLIRCAVRPQEPPHRSSDWLTDPPRLQGGLSIAESHSSGRLHSLGPMPLEQAKSFVLSHPGEVGPWPLVMPLAWELPSLGIEDMEKRMSGVRGVSLEKLGVWRDDFRPVLGEMMASWPDELSTKRGDEVVDFALPTEVKVGIFGCTDFWQIPALLQLELPELNSEVKLAAWWRRLSKRWGARPFLLADDIIWFQMREIPEDARRELFLADLLNLSSDVAECFEPSMIKGAGEKFLFPVPLQLTLRENPQS